MANNIYKNIPVTPEIYARIKEQAAARFHSQRALGILITEWASACAHQPEKLKKVGQTTVELGTISGGTLTQPVQIVLCYECGKMLVQPLDVFDADARAVAAVKEE